MRVKATMIQRCSVSRWATRQPARVSISGRVMASIRSKGGKVLETLTKPLRMPPRAPTR